MDLSILIVTFRCCEEVHACLHSVFDGAHSPFEVILVDNGSADGTAEMVAEEYPVVRLIALDANIGFAAANNLGAAAARGTHLVLLNPDTIVHDRALERLRAFAMEHPEGGLYGGRTLSPDGHLDPRSCWGAPTLWSTLCFALGLSTAIKRNPLFDQESLGRWERDSIRQVGVVTGCLLLCHRELWERLGGFDERFFMYGEDADLSIRARKMGYAPMITPEATITHVVGASSPRDGSKMVGVLRARVTLMRKHWSSPAAATGVRLLALGVLLRAIGSRTVALAGGSSDRGFIWRVAWRERRTWRQPYPVRAAHASADLHPLDGEHARNGAVSARREGDDEHPPAPTPPGS